MEVYKNLPEGTLAELIDNVIYVSPSPVYKHQEVLQEISSQLKEKLKHSGKVTIAPFDVFLNETNNAVQPDIAVILTSNTGVLVPNGYFHGVPDIIIEILSPGNKEFDLVKKKELYERLE
jgi:Uma2 family endonuclease